MTLGLQNLATLYIGRMHSCLATGKFSHVVQLRRLVRFNEHFSRLALVDDTFHYSEQI